jgi:adenylate cyclase
MSGDPEQDYFVDGMVEDITTALSRIGGLFVIARSSAFTYKGGAIDVRQVGRELGVRYVVEGSARKAGGRVRINCQLIDAVNCAHLWADKFDSALDDVFDLQDRVTESVAGAIEPTLRKLEIERATNKPTSNLDAYDLYLRALPHADRFTREGYDAALKLLEQAIAIDPHFALAKALFALCVCRQYSIRVTLRDSPTWGEALEFARSVLTAATDDPTVHSFAGQAVAVLVSDLSAARLALDRALSLNPNSALTLRISGLIHILAGQWEAARENLLRAVRLSPYDSAMPAIHNYLSQAAAGMEDFEQALTLSRKVRAVVSDVAYNGDVLIYSLVNTGRLDEAREVAREMLARDPKYTIASLRTGSVETWWSSDRFLAALRVAGIPEEMTSAVSLGF